MVSDDRAIVLDAEQRSSLAVTRSLGRGGIAVTSADTSTPTLSSRSRYSQTSRTYPDPSSEPSAFIASLAALGPFTEPPVLVACTDASVPVVNDSALLRGLYRTCLPPAAGYAQLSDKWTLHELAEACGVAVPATWRLAPKVRHLGDIPRDIDLLVVKPRQSVQEFAGKRAKLPVLQLKRAQLEAALAEDLYPEEADLLVQRPVAGWGMGVCVVCDRGSVVAWFAHRRLREKPPWGGVSVLCESIPVPPRLRDQCVKLVEATQWHGPAMFEFKMTDDGQANLIEVNGRLWGSVQLAIDCGVDVPLMMFRLARGERIETTAGYAIGRRMRWLLGDLSHLYMVLRRRGVGAAGRSRLSTLYDVLLARSPNTSIEDWRYGDFGPFRHQLAAELRL